MEEGEPPDCPQIPPPGHSQQLMPGTVCVALAGSKLSPCQGYHLPGDEGPCPLKRGFLGGYLPPRTLPAPVCACTHSPPASASLSALSSSGPPPPSGAPQCFWWLPVQLPLPSGPPRVPGRETVLSGRRRRGNRQFNWNSEASKCASSWESCGWQPHAICSLPEGLEDGFVNQGRNMRTGAGRVWHHLSVAAWQGLGAFTLEGMGRHRLGGGRMNCPSRGATCGFRGVLWNLIES